MDDLKLQIPCGFCGAIFTICRKCFRNHRYCGTICRDHGYRENQDRARKKYNKSIEAILDHRDRSQRYRLRKKTVTDKSIPLLKIPVITPRGFLEPGLCIICERLLDRDRDKGRFYEGLELLTIT